MTELNNSRQTLDELFALTAQDSSYQKEALQIENQFARCDWEAFVLAETASESLSGPNEAG
jgi:hypothetical protein